VPWMMLRDMKGISLKYVMTDETGNFLLDDYEKLFTDKTKFVSLTHMSNVLGTITPAADIVRIAHAHHVPVLLDGSQAAVHLDVDVTALDCDFYVFTGHKTYGPSGIGVLYGKEAWLEKLPPFLGGGEMIETVTLDKVTYAGLPHKFEAGTPPIVQAIGLGAALDYMESLGREAIHAHEADLTAYALDKLQAMNDVRLIGTAKDKGSLFSFALRDIHAHDVATLLDRYGIAVRAGTHCAQPLLKLRPDIHMQGILCTL
jgi:cysteine desulfurase / selenocysteine lyase